MTHWVNKILKKGEEENNTHLKGDSSTVFTKVQELSSTYHSWRFPHPLFPHLWDGEMTGKDKGRARIMTWGWQTLCLLSFLKTTGFSGIIPPVCNRQRYLWWALLEEPLSSMPCMPLGTALGAFILYALHAQRWKWRKKNWLLDFWKKSRKWKKDMENPLYNIFTFK